MVFNDIVTFEQLDPAKAILIFMTNNPSSEDRLRPQL